MSRKRFPTTDETRDVLRGHEATIAKAKGCCPSYIYNIKNMEEPDPYPEFREWFQYCAIGKGNVRVYLHDLELIAHEAEHGQVMTLNLTDKLVKKLDTDAHSSHVLASANADNSWDERECEAILASCDRVDTETSELRKMALTRQAELRGSAITNFARIAVNKRRG